MENIDVSWYLQTHPDRGPDHQRFIAERSCHNQQIEHRESCFLNLFDHIESEGLLDIDLISTCLF